MELTRRAAWRFLIDWDADGDFDTPEDDVTAYVKSAQWRLGMHQAWQLTSDETSCTLELANADRRFSPENSASPLFGKLLPQRQIRIEAQQIVVMNDGVTPVLTNEGELLCANPIRMYTGWISGVSPAPMQHAGPFNVIIQGVGASQFLKGTELSLPLMENVRGDEILQAIFARSMFPPSAQGSKVHVIGIPGRMEIGLTTYVGTTEGFYALDPGLIVYPFAGDNFDTFASAYDAAVAVVVAERGRFFYRRDGRAVFWNRHHIQAINEIAAVYDDSMQGLTYDFGNDVVNDVRVTVYPRVLSDTSDEILWQLDQPVSIPAGATQDIRARYAAADGQQVSGRNVAIPNTDDGTLHFKKGKAVFKKFDSDARSATLTLHNTNKSKECVVDTVIIKGQKLTSWNAQESNTVDAVSISLYGRQVQHIDARLLGDTSFAKSVADAIVFERKTPRGIVRELRFMNSDSGTLDEMLQRTMGDRITVRESQTAVDGDYIVIGETHDWRDAGLRYTATLSLEPAPRANAHLIGIWGRAEIGLTTYVGF